MQELILYEVKQHHIAMITLNRPESMNAMSIALLDQLNQKLKEIAKDSNIRVLIITGAGQKAFSAGADLKERRHMTDNEVLETVQYIGKTMNNIEQLKIPVIAAINGAAIGGGLELALACDIRVAADQVKIGLTETSLAIIPGAGGTQRLPRLIGLGHAKRLIYTATPILANEACTIGLVEKTVESEELQQTALAIAVKMAENGPIGVQSAKQAMNQGIQVDLHTGLEIEHLCYQQTLHTADRLEGLQAFRDKRKPKYSGE